MMRVPEIVTICIVLLILATFAPQIIKEARERDNYVAACKARGGVAVRVVNGWYACVKENK